MNISPRVAGAIIVGVALALVLFVWSRYAQAQREKQYAEIRAQQDASEQRVATLKEAFKKEQPAIQLEADRQKRFAEGQQAMADAQREPRLAEIKAQEQKALAQSSTQANP